MIPRSAVAGAIGNTVEWFDFAVYGYFAREIGEAFFPADVPSLQLLSAFAVFAMGYLMRPIGGLVLGPLGDVVGGRALLLVSVAVMAASSSGPIGSRAKEGLDNLQSRNRLQARDMSLDLCHGQHARLSRPSLDQGGIYSMRTLCWLLLVGSVSACGVQKDQAPRDTSCKPPADLSEISGQYSAVNIGINSIGKHVGVSKLSIDVDNDGVISGTRSWESKTNAGHKEDGTLTKSHVEEIIGVVDPFDCEIGLAEYDEDGSYRGRLMPDGSIDIILVQSGKRPVAVRNHYKRIIR